MRNAFTRARTRLSPIAIPHPVHQGRMRDLVEAGLDVALHDPLVGVGRRDGAPRPPRHGSGGSGGTRRSTGGNPPRRSAPTPASRTPGPPDRARSAIPSRRTLAARLGDHPLPHRQRAEAAVLQLRPAARRGTPRRPARLRRSGRSAPSTPAVRAPLLPRTRSQATSRNAGIGDEVEQIIEPAMRIITGPTVQLGLDLQYPSLRPKQRELQIRRYSPATSWHSSILPADLLAPFAMCTASRRARTTTGPPPHPAAIGRRRTCPPTGLAARSGRATGDGSHVHHAIDRRGEAPSSTPTASPRLRRRPSPWPPHRTDQTGFGVDPPPHRAVTVTRCTPAHIRQV